MAIKMIYASAGQNIKTVPTSSYERELIPSVLLTLGAGMLFGLFKGSLLIVVARTIGAYVAFLPGHRILSAQMEKLLEKRTRRRAVLELPGRHDWRLVALTRMLPFFSFNGSSIVQA